MTKHYSSDSQIAVNVVLSSGKSMHVSFTPLSNGSSVYSTDSEDVQEALERHYRFGSLFVLDHSDDPDGSVDSEVDTGPGTDHKGEDFKPVKVSDIGEAKDYLADTFGVSRTSLRSQKAILEAAKANGIVFEGL